MADCSVRVYREIIEERLDPEVLTDKVLFELYYYNYLTLKAYMDWTISSSGRSGECLVDYVLACMPPDLEPILNCGKATDSQ